MSERVLKRGDNWRLGWNPATPTYQALIGGEDWAIELTAAEFADFRRLISQLSRTMEDMGEVLMDEEKITCEAESDLLWLECQGFPGSYSLRVILRQGRRCEGNWSAIATGELITALETFSVF